MAAKKILMGLTYYYPNISGLTKYASILAEELVKRKHEVTVITGSPENKLSKRETLNGVKVVRSGGFKIGKGLVMPMYGLVCLPLVAKSDVVICHLPSLESWWLALWTNILKKKLIVTYHCQFNSGNKVLDWVVDFVQNQICKSANTIVVNSLDYVIGYGLLANFRKKIIEIYPPIKLDNSIQEISIDGVGVGTQIIGFLGRISREKNIEILLDAIPYLEKNGIDFVVAIAGPQEIEGEEKYKEKIFDLLTRYKNRIRSLGKLSEGQKNNFLKKCDCLVLPSNNPLESFGMVVAEAMTLGTPSVVSDIPGVRVPVLKTGIGETFKTNDTRDLADKIKKILSVKVNKKTVALRAREHFNLDKTIDSYESFFC